MRIAIAEACGWKWYRIPKRPYESRRYRALFLPSVHEYEGQSEAWLEKADGSESVCNIEFMAREGHVPDYPNDLNAMHEAEAQLFGDGIKCAEYCSVLSKICYMGTNHATWFLIDATARHRAEAFLRTLNL
jgi:hypothetical protein